MPIPRRLRLEPASRAAVDEMTALCNRIEDAAIDDATELEELLAKWNARASRTYEATEFRTYYGAMSTEDFVRTALAPKPRLVKDLTYAEARDVVDVIARAELSQSEHDYFLDWLEANFPDADVIDLIYWPNQWLSDESLDVDLDADQIVAYAMSRSGRELADAPDVVLPRPDPLARRKSVR